jgi:hypothetical protein
LQPHQRNLVENFCGLPSTIHGEREVKISRVHDAIEIAIQSIVGRCERLTMLTDLWPRVIGKTLAAHCRPCGLRGVVLEIYVDCDAAAQEIFVRKGKILAAVRSLPNCHHVKKIITKTAIR